MKHTIEGCLIKYNVPTVNGHYFSPEAFKDITGTMVPISTSYAFNTSESKIIGSAKLENREDGVYYKATLNDEKATDDMIDLVKNHNYFLGIYANHIKRDPGNMKCIVDGKIRAMAFTPKCDDSACVLTIDDEPFVNVEGSNKAETINRDKVIAELTMLTDRTNDDTCEGLKCCKIAEDVLSLLKEQEAVEPICKIIFDIPYYFCGQCNEMLNMYSTKAMFCSKCGRPVKWCTVKY